MEKEAFLGHVSDDSLKEIVAIQDRIKKLDTSGKAKKDFIHYINNVWDGFIEGEHHKLFAKKLEAVANGKCTHVIPNLSLLRFTSLAGSWA